jgi:hypothetical protein
MLTRFFLTVLLCALLPVASALDLTEAERSLLPPYCKFTQLIGNEVTHAWSPGAQRYVNRWGGKNQSHLHHFCWAKANYARSLRARASPQERRSMRESAIGDLNYSIRESTPDFELHPEMQTLRGVLLGLIGRGPEAESAFKTALEHNAKYVPAYVELIALYKATGKKAEEKATREKASQEGVTLPPQ